ncbi:MAG: hypothetical protein ACK55G_08530 [Dolichospermum sp.]
MVREHFDKLSASQGTGNTSTSSVHRREQGTGFGQLYFSLLISVFFRSPT